jgi:hypothetical protein
MKFYFSARNTNDKLTTYLVRDTFKIEYKFSKIPLIKNAYKKGKMKNTKIKDMSVFKLEDGVLRSIVFDLAMEKVGNRQYKIFYKKPVTVHVPVQEVLEKLAERRSL